MPNQPRTIFITGSANGIGRTTARWFADRNFFVGAFDIDESGLRTLSEELGTDRCVTGILDVRRPEDFARAMGEFCQHTNGQLDILFNNAGVLRLGPMMDMEDDDIFNQININFLATIRGIRCAMPYLRSTESSMVFNMSSSVAICGVQGASIYSATKHAVKGLTESLNDELRGDGIKVCDALPGLVDTHMIDGHIRSNIVDEGMWRLMPPEAVAETVWNAYHGDRVHWYVPDELQSYERFILDKFEPVIPNSTQPDISAS